MVEKAASRIEGKRVLVGEKLSLELNFQRLPEVSIRRGPATTNGTPSCTVPSRLPAGTQGKALCGVSGSPGLTLLGPRSNRLPNKKKKKN